MDIITICGSMKKYRLMNLIAKRIMSNMENVAVFTPAMYNCILGIPKEETSKKEYLNRTKQHRFLMNRSDYILIIDYDMGDDTHEELIYAEDNKMCIVRLSEIIQYFKNDEEIMKEIIG